MKLIKLKAKLVESVSIITGLQLSQCNLKFYQSNTVSNLIAQVKFYHYLQRTVFPTSKEPTTMTQGPLLPSFAAWSLMFSKTPCMLTAKMLGVSYNNIKFI